MATRPNYRPNIQLPNLMGHTGNPYNLNLYPQDMIFEKPAGWDDTKGVIDTSNPKVNFAGFNFGNNQNTNNQGLGWWMNADRSRYPSPLMPPMLDPSGQMGAYTNTPRTPEGIPFHPDQGNRGRWSQQNVPDEPGYLRSLWEGTKNLASKFSPTGIINALTFRKGADQSFGGYPGGQFSRAGLFPQEVQNLQALADQGLLRSGAKDAFGTNVVSQFGDYNQHIADKKAQFEAKLKDTDYLATLGMVKSEDNTLEDLYNAYISKYGPNAEIAKRLNHYANFGGTGTGTVADKITVTKPGDGAAATGDGGGGFNPRLDRPAHPSSRPSWHGATKERQAAGKSVAGPGFGQGAYWADGGRVGLYQGGEPEETTEDIFEFMQDQNIPHGEMASDDNNTRILENLFEKYLELGFSPEEAEIKAMEEFQLMSQGQDFDMGTQNEQGIASLV